jgi:hypothetical protein
VKLLMGASERRAAETEQKCRALTVENAQLEGRCKRLARSYRELERAHQTLILRLGMLGYAVEPVAEVPAKPATLTLRKLKAV